MNELIKHIVVVGGGTAGWLSASLLARELKNNGVNITLIESENIATIGVGEGTWPSMRGTLQRIGFPETELFTHCNASFKQGSLFVNWQSEHQPQIYHHPFSAPWQKETIDSSVFWYAQTKQQPFGHTVSGQPRLIEMGKAPKLISTPEYAAINNYGYHFDAAKFAERLTQFAVTSLGVNHLLGDVVDIKTHPNGDIAALVTDRGESLEGDLFLDCSGLTSLLIDKHYKIPFTSVKDELINDSALAVHVPYVNPGDNIESATIATAHPEGWTWEIGLQNRRGVGLVYSSKFCSQEVAHARLLSHVQSLNPTIATIEPKLISFNPGYRDKFWHKNVIAIGMAAGFVEPLEASALVMVEQAIKFLADQFPNNRQELDYLSLRYNTLFKEKWRDIVDFLKLHYVLSKRGEDFWAFHRNEQTQSLRLKAWLTHWQRHFPSHYDFSTSEALFPPASFQYVLYGMNVNPEIQLNSTMKRLAKETHVHYAELVHATKRLHELLPNNRKLIEQIKAHGLTTI
ncbi:tryptophan halogenase, putative [Pseudoalteromonas luteoviolacea B = ATCC 29581]|nr:tryptophan halogenase, putative [Pseudoalteromonas luteoviolacea B = ATCC 29581]